MKGLQLMKPLQHRLRVFIRREDGVEDFLDLAFIAIEREALDEAHMLVGEGRQFQRIREREVCIA